jgi:acyl-CoA dehydrogenase
LFVAAPEALVKLARAAQIAQGKVEAGDDAVKFYATKIKTAAFYAGAILPEVAAQAHTMLNSTALVMSIDEELM